MQDTLRVALAQIAPVWLDRDATTRRVLARMDEAAAAGARLVVFGEALLPGYPFWVELTEGARFESARQKAFYAHYVDQAVHLPSGHLEPIQRKAREHKLAVYLGAIERAADRSGYSLYATLFFIDAEGELGSSHRKLMPTYEERLVWSPGDGHGLRTHPLGPFTVGGLNCWENWMPLARTALYGQGEDLHVAVWPGSRRNTADISRFIARESRSFVLSVSGLMRPADVPDSVPEASQLRELLPAYAADGGSTLVRPNGEYLLEPVCHQETVLIADLDPSEVRAERQNFDATGHYSRADVTELIVHRRRQHSVTLDDD